MALGIGTNVAIFSVIDAVILRPVQAPDPDRVVVFMTTSPAGPQLLASPAKFNFWRHQTGAFQDICAYRFGVLNLTGVEHPRQIQSAQVSANYFRLFGLRTVRGRTFSAEEDRPNAGNFAVISEGFWRQSFARDTTIVGNTISLSGKLYLIVGIMPADVGTEAPEPIDVWVPLQIDPNSIEENHYFTTAARLKPGVTLAAANAQLRIALNEFNRKFPFDLTMGPQHGFAVQPIRDVLIGDVRSPLLVLFGAVSCVLLIACANVANLMLARAAGRKREIAIRAALGAGRRRIIAQLIAEGITLSVAGGALGLLLGMAGIRALLAINSGGIPRLGPSGTAVNVDWRVLAFTLLASVTTGILFSLIPALQASSTDLSAILRKNGGRMGTGIRQNRARSFLVASEMALAIILLIGAGLLIRTFVALRSVNPGFDRHNVLTMRISLNAPKFQKTAGLADLVRNSALRITELRGVVAAASTCCVPLELSPAGPVFILGRPRKGLSDGHAHLTTISSGYFAVLKIPLLRGRIFTDRDDARSTPVVIINRAMARMYWPNSDPFKDRMMAAQAPARQIVGIVGDVHDTGLDDAPPPMMYLPIAQAPEILNAYVVRRSPITWMIRTSVEPHSLSAAIEKELQQASGGLPVTGIRSLDELVARSTARQDFNVAVMSVFGMCALLLAAIGLYGLMAYSVQQRTQEIGIRMALGAEMPDVRDMVVLQGMRLASSGVVIGIAVAFGLTRFISGFLFGVKALDPIAFVAAPVVLIAVALLSVWLPVRRATRIDPAIALRFE
jgi:predicted permease